MKTFKTTLAALMITLGTLNASAQPMSYYTMRDNARFLTDRMIHVLNLSAALIDEIYCINYDYICGVNDYLDDVALGYRYDDYVTVLHYRDAALRRLLTEAEWRLLMTYDDFYRPISFVDHRWRFAVYAHDRWGGRYFYAEPRYYADYRGGRHFGGMAPGHGTVIVNNINVNNNNNRYSAGGNRDHRNDNRGTMNQDNYRNDNRGNANRNADRNDYRNDNRGGMGANRGAMGGENISRNNRGNGSFNSRSNSSVGSSRSGSGSVTVSRSNTQTVSRGNASAGSRSAATGGSVRGGGRR